VFLIWAKIYWCVTWDIPKVAGTDPNFIIVHLEIPVKAKLKKMDSEVEIIENELTSPIIQRGRSNA
jgi:hypothetical protein